MEVKKSFYIFLVKVFNYFNFKYKQRRRYLLKKIRKGTPCHLDWEIVNQVCNKIFGCNLISIENQKLSGWKKTGTYRLLITLENNEKTSLIYRHCDYNAKDFPALAEYPIKLGPAEYEIGKLQNKSLIRYLPKTYWSYYDKKDIYRYLQEDLSLEGFKSISGLDNYIIPFTILLKNKLNESNFHIDEIPKYDYTYSSSLVSYIKELWYKKWDAKYNLSYGSLMNITELFHEISMHEINYQLIHGDLNNANILVKFKNGKYVFKIVDWEWAGIGIVHSDIAAYFRNANYPELGTYLANGIGQNQEETLLYHYKWLYWAFMNRALIDISIMSAQKNVSQSNNLMNIDKFIADSVINLKTAYNKIQKFI